MAGRSVARLARLSAVLVGGGDVGTARACIDFDDVDYVVGMMLPRHTTLAVPSSLANERRG